jgi:phosphohistidine phosphatase SixA
MKICLLRHGSRDLTSSSDNGLNQAGIEMAKSLPSKLIPQGEFPVPTLLRSSPKRRARETLGPLSEKLHKPLKVDSGLDERQNAETSVQFRTRVRNYLEQLRKQCSSADVAYLCTHADWLEEAIIILSPESIADGGFACGELRIFEM